MQNILFVCTGNICRSPTAEGVLRHTIEKMGLSEKLHVDSAGTQGYHTGEPPDPRAIRAARNRGIDLGALRARQVSLQDFQRFDHIMALDRSHLQALTALAPREHTAHIALFLETAGATVETEVPDPYYGSQKDFDYVLDLIEAATEPLIRKWTTG